MDGLRRSPSTERTVSEKLGSLPGVKLVEPSALTGNVLVLFDRGRWTPESLLTASGRALGLSPTNGHVPDERASAAAVSVRSAPAPGRVRLAVPGLRRAPEREPLIEARVRAVPGVQLAHANAWTGNVLVLFDPAACGVDQLVAACADLTEGPDAVRPSRWRRAQGPTVEEVERPGEPMVPWHALDLGAVTGQLAVDPERGLDAAKAQKRRARHGLNRMPETPEPSLLKLLGGQFVNAPTALLAAGAGISIATGGLFEAALIAAVLGINAVVGAGTERTGHRSIAALRQSTAIRARARRSGGDVVLDADELVPGDVIQLVPGDPVPADARLLSVQRLAVEESALTGESRPVDKVTVAVDPRLPLADRRSLVHRGTTVVAGRGTAIVVETGPRTALGQLHALAASADAPPTPMERDLSQTGRRLAVGASTICGGVFGLGVLRGSPLLYSLEVAVSLGVAAIPEGLTALATTVLALASGRLRQKGTLIRTLGAAEALGSVTVVCADKTGTLTENRMAARELYVAGRTVRIGGAALSPRGTFEADGSRLDPRADRAVERALLVGALCSDAELEVAASGRLVVDGSATEGALQVAALKAGLDPARLRSRYPRRDGRDRADGRRHMLTVHTVRGRPTALMKGSPEEVLGMCERVRLVADVAALDDATRAEIGRVNAEMAGRAMRVLALAQRTLPERYEADELSRGYTFLGLIGLVDPIRPAVPGAVRALHGAGIRTIMITGDQALTATAVARELGLSRRGSLHVLEAGDLSAISPDALRGLVRDVGIFARVPPEMKLAVVRALQANGHVVAMTGDGVNDGPALRAADVGVAMGERGTELARELADVVLSTDDFAQMVDAVEEGRLVRANVRRVLHYMLSTNASEVWVVSGAVAMGLPSPLTPLQLLWLNLVTDLAPGLGLAVEPREPDLMRQPPRDPKEPIIPKPLYRRMLVESGAIAAGALGAYGVGIARHGLGPVAQTMAFASLLGAQLLHVPLARAGNDPATRSDRPRNRTLKVGMAISAALQVVALFFPPVRAVLGGAALGLADLAIAGLGAALPIAAIEAQRLFAARQHKALPEPRP